MATATATGAAGSTGSSPLPPPAHSSANQSHESSSKVTYSSIPGYLNLGLNALGSYSIVQLVEEALADIGGLHTYRHGTSPRNYFSILFTGGDPEKGGRVQTGTNAAAKFFGKDDKTEVGHKGQFALSTEYQEQAEDCGQLAADAAGAATTRIMPVFYSITACVGEQNYPKEIGKNESWGLADYGTLITGLFLSIMTPTLKFHFTPDEEVDQHIKKHNDASCFTISTITPDHIGLVGTVMHGLSGGVEGLKGRVSKDYDRFLRGVIKLVAAVAIVALALVALYYTSVLGAIVKAVLMYETAVCVGRIVVPLLFGLICPEIVEAAPKQDAIVGGSGPSPSAPAAPAAAAAASGKATA